MRKLTFPGFLTQYVVSLSSGHTSAVYPLVREAASENPRLREPLYLYALFTGRIHTLLTASKGTKLYDEYLFLSSTFSVTDTERLLQDGSDTLRYEYQKVWNSYLSVSSAQERDNMVKGMMRERSVALLEEKQVSVYSVCKNLSLNRSNVNVWLKHGDNNKVSLSVAREVMRYLEK